MLVSNLLRAGCCRLTFQVRRIKRQGTRPGPVKMYRVPPARAWRPAVGASPRPKGQASPSRLATRLSGRLAPCSRQPHAGRHADAAL